MTTSSEQINALIQAGNAWKAEADALLADRVAHQTAYEALADDLKNVVAGQMNFTAYVDPDTVDPTLINGGTFQTIKQAVDAAPVGSAVAIQLEQGKTHAIPEAITVRNKYLKFNRQGAGPNPIVTVPTSLIFGLNGVRGFWVQGTSPIVFHNTEIVLPNAELDVNVGWSSIRSVIDGDVFGPVSATLYNSTVKGGVAGQDLGFTSARAGCKVSLDVYGSTFAGEVCASINASEGITMISKRVVTVQDNAKMIDAGAVLGTNYLTN